MCVFPGSGVIELTDVIVTWRWGNRNLMLPTNKHFRGSRPMDLLCLSGGDRRACERTDLAARAFKHQPDGAVDKSDLEGEV